MRTAAFPLVLWLATACAPARRPAEPRGIAIAIDGGGPSTAALVRQVLAPAGNTLVEDRWRADTLVLYVLFARDRFATATPEIAVLATIPGARSREPVAGRRVWLEAWYTPVTERAELGTIHRQVGGTATTPRAYRVRRSDDAWKRLDLVADALVELGARRAAP